MNMAPVIVVLAVEVTNSHVYINLEYENITDQIIQIDQISTCLDGKIRGKFFKIVGPENELVQYLGPMVKRKPGPYISIKPKEKKSTRVELTSNYGFLSGKHDYIVKYSVFDPFKGLDDMYELESNSVQFTFGK